MAGEPRDGERPSRRDRRRVGRGWLWLLVPALALVAVHVLVAEPMRVPSGSMQPTLRPGDHVVVDKLTYRLRDARRFELVVFDLPDGGLGLKRVVGLPGDRVALKDGALYVNGRPVREDFVDRESVDGTYFGPVTVPGGRLFLLGDQRANSRDSRDFGPVPAAGVVGRAVFIVWPPGRLGPL